ncbi:MAG: CIA30 family protein [Gemmatimonadota bacterium]
MTPHADSGPALGMSPDTPIVALSPPRPGQWLVVNDNVMGGRSAGAVQLARHGLVFSGALITKGGGFASLRSRSLDIPLEPYTGISLRVVGDGREYACDLREAASVSGSGVAWKARFTTQAGQWLDVRLPFSTFEPTWRGSVMRAPGGGPEATFHHTVTSVGFTIADERDGPFRLEVAGIGAF